MEGGIYEIKSDIAPVFVRNFHIRNELLAIHRQSYIADDSYFSTGIEDIW